MRLFAFSGAIMALAAFVPSTNALPAADYHKRGTLSSLQGLMPAGTLPAPDGLKLKFVGLGIGTQNYTCTGDQSAAPGTTGATATLYDLGSALVYDPWAQWKLNTITPLALSMYWNKDAMTWFLAASNYKQVLGKHFFTPASPSSIPTFSLYEVKENPFPIAYVAKKDNMTAPEQSFKGLTNEGAVPWLRLVDNGSSQGGVNTVYRIETAGGASPKTCSGKPAHFEVPYAAQYWIYGSWFDCRP